MRLGLLSKDYIWLEEKSRTEIHSISGRSIQFH